MEELTLKKVEELANRMAELNRQELDVQGKRMEELFQQQAEQLGRTVNLEGQVSAHNKCLFHPVCIRQLCVQAAELISQMDGSKHGPGVITPELCAPAWATAWLKDAGGCIELDDRDLALIFATAPPESVRVEGNNAVHDIKQADQAAAVHAVADAEQRASLTRIFDFVHKNRSPA